MELNGQELEGGVGGEQDPDIERNSQRMNKNVIFKQNLLAFYENIKNRNSF